MHQPAGFADLKGESMGSLRKLSDGTLAQGVVVLTENGEIANPVPFLQQDLIGNARNYYPDRARGFVFGKKRNLGNVLSDLWGGPTALYVFPASPMQMQIVSSSANDAAAETGVRAVRIHYLDHNYQPQITDVTMNGTTPVLTVPTDIIRINGMHAMAVGSNVVSVGNISLQAIGGAVTYGFITAGDNTSRQAIYTVPDGMWGYISHWQASSGSANNHFCQTIVAATTHDAVVIPGVFLLQDEAGTQNGGLSIDFPIPIPIPPKADVRMLAIGDASNAGITALGAIMGWFEPV